MIFNENSVYDLPKVLLCQEILKTFKLDNTIFYQTLKKEWKLVNSNFRNDKENFMPLLNFAIFEDKCILLYPTELLDGIFINYQEKLDSNLFNLQFNENTFNEIGSCEEAKEKEDDDVEKEEDEEEKDLKDEKEKKNEDESEEFSIKKSYTFQKHILPVFENEDNDLGNWDLPEIDEISPIKIGHYSPHFLKLSSQK